MTLRILHLITGLGTGGAEHMLEKLAGGMDRAQFSSAVISLTGEGAVGPRLRRSGIPVHALGIRGWQDVPGALLTLRRLVDDIQPDILQTWLYHADLVGTLVHWLARSPAALAWNLRCSDMNLADYALSTRLVLRAVVAISARPAFVVTNSEAGRRHHAALGYKPRRWVDIPNGFDTSLFRPRPEASSALRAELGIPERTPVVGMVARLDPMKDHDTFVAMAGILAARHPEMRFVLVGRGCTAAAPLLAAAQRRLEGRLHLLGERQDIPMLLAGMDVGVLTSAYGEGFPNVLGEALATGLPCVATDVGDAAAILGDCGIVVPPRDAAALAAGVETLLARGDAERSAAQQRARRRAEENFSLQAAIRCYESVYSEAAPARQVAANFPRVPST